MLKFLYETFAGRIILKLLSARWLSILAGKWLDRPSSKFLIKPFLKKGNIDLSEYQKEDYKCFNDCFT
ncbi:MAG: phosphatidylserine decarboxylase, partial [Lachnospiraceae bacterium]|nr:phosphatidylserine decarboxylase [Lachnospiraceae bacterium]